MNENIDYRVGSDIFMKTARDGKEIRKAYETVEWMSDEEINKITHGQFTIFGNNIEENEGTYTLSLVSGDETTINLLPNDYIGTINISSDSNVAYVSNNIPRKIIAKNPGTANITIYDGTNPELKATIEVTVEQ